VKDDLRAPRESLEPLAVRRIRFEAMHETAAAHFKSEPRREIAGTRADVYDYHFSLDDRVDHAPLLIATSLRSLPP
jgi:hypothetical protein